MTVRVDGNLDCNDGELLHRWVSEGLGLGWRSTWEIQAQLQRGELVTVLDAFALPAYDILAVYPQQRHLPGCIDLRLITATGLHQPLRQAGGTPRLIDGLAHAQIADHGQCQHDVFQRDGVIHLAALLYLQASDKRLIHGHRRIIDTAFLAIASPFFAVSAQAADAKP